MKFPSDLDCLASNKAVDSEVVKASMRAFTAALMANRERLKLLPHPLLEMLK